MNTQQMKIPKSGATRISNDIWLIGEALSRYYRTENLRVALEAIIRIGSDRLQETDPEYAKILSIVRQEGIEND